MEDVFLSTQLDDKRMVCISPLSSQTYREVCGHGLGGDHGYFIYEVDLHNPQAGIDVIGKAASAEAAIRLYDLIVAQNHQ
ncbi:MAG: hypothetical protein GC131_00580 [Alphaproteobacteria bacterium]|nr:hypothetical protein [Alphaproteobacteria bacterium]